MSEANRMELLNMSGNNRWFLFFNRVTLGLAVYELREQPRADFAESFMVGDAGASRAGGSYVFSPSW